MKEGLKKLVDSLRNIKAMIGVCTFLGIIDDEFTYEQFEMFGEMSNKIHTAIDEFIAAFED